MNIRRSVFWFGFIVLVLVALALWFGKKEAGRTAFHGFR